MSPGPGWTRPQRPLMPTRTDLRKWRRLAVEAEGAAGTVTLTGDLAAAAATARRAVAPNREAQLAVCSPLIRLAEAWGGLDTEGRADRRADLRRLAQALADLTGAVRRAPAGQPPSGPVEPRAPRKDIYG